MLLRTGRSGIRIPAERRNFPLLQKFRPALESEKPPIQWVLVFFPGVKRPRRVAIHWPLSSVEVKNECGRTSAPRSCLHGVHRDKCTFLHRRYFLKQICFTFSENMRIFMWKCKLRQFCRASRTVLIGLFFCPL